MLYNSGYSLMLGLGLFLNGTLFRFFEKRFISWLDKPVQSVTFAFLISLIYSTLVIFFTNWFWYVNIHNIPWERFWSWGKTLILWEYIIIYIIASIQYSRSFLREWRNSAIEKEKLKNQALALQYETLSNQVNPHFLFNSLNVLLSLIDRDVESAKTFTTQLSAFYRQLLALKDKQLIPVDDEIEIMRNYLNLQQIRFGNSLEVNINILPGNSHLIIPLTLQLLVENAFKHNALSQENPMQLSINQTDNRLIVRNNLQRKKQIPGNSQIGLKNLNERYLFLTGKNIEINITQGHFEVQIPLIEAEL
jgi:sensor histidine kinase YesM